MERRQQGSGATIGAVFYSDAAAVNPVPDTATVQITRADGSVLVASTAATPGTTGAFSYTLTPAQMALLDTLSATWVATIGGQQQTIKTYIEVVGGFLCTLAELQPLFPTASVAELAAIRTVAEQRVETACGQAYVARYALERHFGRRRLRLCWPHVRAIRSLTVGPAGSPYAYPAASLAALEVRENVICLDAGYWSGAGSALVGYEHGHDAPGEDIRRAVLLAAQESYDTSGESRVVRREADGQAVTFASPSGSSGFVDPLLRSIIADNQRPLVA